MKIELSNLDFKILFDTLQAKAEEVPAIKCVVEKLKPQYYKSFKKYENEKQNFNLGQIVLFKDVRQKSFTKKGEIVRIIKLINGQHKYVIEHEYEDENGTKYKARTNPIVQKKIQHLP